MIKVAFDRELYERIREWYSEAGRVAEVEGERIGSVSRAYPVELREDRRALAIEIPFGDYCEFVKSGGKLSIGDFICIVNPLAKTLVLGRVVGFKREDIMSVARIPMPPSVEDYSTVFTPVILYVDLISERPYSIVEGSVVLKGEIAPPATPVEPMSPVFLPNSSIIYELLGIPRRGVKFGVLRQGSKDRTDVDISLDFGALYHHVLIVGTTGSGKTVLLKNLMLSLASSETAELPLALAFDIQGDYLHILLPNDKLGDRERKLSPVNKLVVIHPVTVDYINTIRREVERLIRVVSDKKVAVNILGLKMAEKYVSATFKGYLELVDCEVLSEDFNGRTLMKEVRAICSRNDGSEVVIRLVPYALLFDKVREGIGNVMPTFTALARALLPRIMDALERGVEHVVNVGRRRVEIRIERRERVNLDDVIGELMREEGGLRDYLSLRLKAHTGTIDNICRTFNMAQDTGVFDVEIQIGDITVSIGEPNYAKLFEDPSVKAIVVDLRGIGMYSRAADQANTIVVYRILEKLFEWKNERLKEGVETRPAFIIIDEAHNYFPQTIRGDREVNKDVVEGLINRITRLGRMRKIGVIFATHRPEDLNDLVLQLTNTKIGLRSEREVLERIGMSEFSSDLRVAPSGVGVMKSPALRCQALFFRSYPPQCFHRSPT